MELSICSQAQDNGTLVSWDGSLSFIVQLLSLSTTTLVLYQELPSTLSKLDSESGGTVAAAISAAVA